MKRVHNTHLISVAGIVVCLFALGMGTFAYADSDDTSNSTLEQKEQKMLFNETKGEDGLESKAYTKEEMLINKDWKALSEILNQEAHDTQAFAEQLLSIQSSITHPAKSERWDKWFEIKSEPLIGACGG
jgi:DNA gyrase/topoisomerase IV subunit A